MPTDLKPYGVATFKPRGSEGRAWLLLDGEYVEVTLVCSHITLEANVGGSTELVLRIPCSASGDPADFEVTT